jgi:hypothetical protein
MTPAETPEAATDAAASLATPADAPTVHDAPSADFVRAVSDFLDTDPADLLAEMGYYDRPLAAPAPAAAGGTVTFSGRA